MTMARLLVASLPLLAVLMLAVQPAAAQTNTEWDSLYDRIIRLEHRLRSIEQGGGTGGYQQATPSYGGDPSSAAAMSLRIDQVEGQMRTLLGEVQELSFKMQQLSEQLRRFSEDAEFRFQELEGRVRGGQAPSSSPDNTQVAELQEDSLAPYGDLSVLDQYPTTDGGAGPIDLNQAPSSGVLGTLPLSELEPSDQYPSALPEAVETVPLDGSAPAQQQASTGVGATSPAEQLYEDSYNDLLRRRFEAAESGFSRFLRDHRDHGLAGNAQYWLGETHYARGDYREAAAAFLTGYRDFRTSPKAPDSLLKLGMSLSNMGEKEQACSVFQQVGQEFADAPETIRTIAARERDRAGC